MRKIIGIGGMGCVALGKINPHMYSQMNLFAMDTDICPFNWLQFDKLHLGPSPLGSGGNPEIGYSRAKEALSDKMNIFENDINIFVFGLGGGTGSGVIKFILENLKGKSTKNIIICTYPLEMEKTRKIKADNALELIKPLADLILLVKLENFHGLSSSISGLFHAVDSAIVNLLYRINTYSKEDIGQYSGIIELSNVNDFSQIFKSDEYCEINTHFTGQGRDLEQLKAISTETAKTFLFVGCATGEEISDFQDINKIEEGEFWGIDKDDTIVDWASGREYKIKPKFISMDVKIPNFASIIHNITKIKKFDVIICRNMMIYYNDETAKKIIQTLASMTDDVLVLGISDPFPFPAEDIVQIAGLNFSLDFDNKIVRRVKNEQHERVS